MPRDHGRILSTIWQDRDFRQRSPEAQRLYLLLLSQHNVNNAGVLPLQVSKWAKGCVYTSVEDIQKALNELAEHRYVLYDDETEEALIRSYMRNDGVMKHPNIVKNALRCVAATESPELRSVLADELRRTGRSDARQLADKLCPPDPNSIPFESHSNPIGMPSRSHPDAESHSNAIGILAGRGRGRGRGEPTPDGYLGEAPPPSPFCDNHPNDTDRGCRACGARREARERWDEQQETLRNEHRAAFWAEVRSATCCDENGHIETADGQVQRCPNHDWEQANV